MPDAATEARPRWLVWVTRASLGLGAVALVMMISLVGVEPILDHLARIGPWFVGLLAIEATQTMVDAGTVYALSRGPGAPSFRSVCVAQFAGRAVNSVTPGSNLGEALKVSLLARGCPIQRIVAAVLFASLGNALTGLAVVAIGTIATAFLFDLPTAAQLVLVTAGTLAAALVIGTLVLVRRGMLAMIARFARRLRVISQARHDRWRDALDDVDRRLRGEIHGEHRGIAIVLVVISQLLQRVLIWMTLLATGYSLGGEQLVAVIAAGVLLTWVSTLVPLGVGVAEGGHGMLFALVGAPASLGVALAFARRVNQVVFAVLGFAVLAADRLVEPGEPDELVPTVMR